MKLLFGVAAAILLSGCGGSKPEATGPGRPEAETAKTKAKRDSAGTASAKTAGETVLEGSVTFVPGGQEARNVRGANIYFVKHPLPEELTKHYEEFKIISADDAKNREQEKLQGSRSREGHKSANDKSFKHIAISKHLQENGTTREAETSMAGKFSHKLEPGTYSFYIHESVGGSDLTYIDEVEISSGANQVEISNLNHWVDVQ